ncbi:MAG: hypothetical protein ACRBDI_08105 [Alphaproteobacteria bacterium]
MLALKQQFEDVNGEAIENTAQEATFDINAPVSNDALYSPDTTYEREVFYDNMLENPDMTVYDNDDIALKMTDTGNDQAYNTVKEMADTSGGELGLNHRMERGVDQKMERFDGSLSQNLSENAQGLKQDYEAGLADKFGNWEEGDALTLTTPDEGDPELNMPEILYLLEKEDPSVAVQAIYFELAEMGVDPNDLDAAMKAGNDYDVLDALSDVAEKNDLTDIAQYGNDVQQSFANIGVPEAIQNVTPEITQVQPEFAMNDLKWDLENQQPKVAAMGMG